MKRAYPVLKHFAFYSLITASIIKLLAVAFAYFAISHRVEIQYWLSKQADVPVSIGSIHVNWNSYIPRLVIKDLSIGENAEIELGDAQIGVHLQALLFRRNVIPLNISLVGTQINILRDSDGRTRILGLSKPDSHQPAITNIALPAFIRIRNATLTWIDNKRDANITLPFIDLELVNLGDEYLLEADLHTDSGNVEMRARTQGNLLTSNWSARTYISSNTFNASDMFASYLPEYYHLGNLLADVNLWSTWVDGKHTGTQGDFHIQPFSLNNNDGKSVPIDALHGSINYQLHSNGWQLQLADFGLSMWQQSWPPSLLSLSQQQTSDGTNTYKFTADFLRVQDVLEIISLEPELETSMAKLLAVNPEADITDMQFSMTDDKGIIDWQLALKIAALNTTPQDKIPGISNFSGSVKANSEHVQLQLDTTNAAIYLQGLFRTPIPLNVLTGQIDLLKDEKNWQLLSHSLVAENNDVETRTRLHLTSNPLFIDLQTNFKNGKMNNAGTYYPTGIMPPNLVEWLDTAIVDGKVTEGSALLYGPLTPKKFPYHKAHDGHFEVLFDARDVVLDYQTGWPAVTNVTATTRFHNNHLDITASQGNIFGSKARHAAVHIPSLNPASQMELNIDATGPVTDIFRFLLETPLRKAHASRIESLAAAGKARFKMDIQIPLDHSDRFVFDGDVTLQDATLQLKDWDIALNNINGHLFMNGTQFKPSILSASTLKTPVTISITPTNRSSTLIQTIGTFPVSEILAKAPFLPALDIQGAAEFQIDVDLPETNDANPTNTLLRIKSNLQGIAINMPEPLGKIADEQRELLFEMPIGESANKININYEQAFDIGLQPTNTGNFDINGTIYDIPVAPWSAFIKTLDFNTENHGTPPVDSVDLMVKHATLGPIETNNLGLIINHNDTGWFGYLSSEPIAGSFKIPLPNSQSPLTIQLDHLHIQYDTESPDEPAPPDFEAAVYADPRSLPALKLSSKSVIFNDADLGSAAISAYPVDDGLIFDNIKLTGELVTVQGEGRWLKESAQVQSQTNIVIDTPDFGELLTKMHFTSQLENAEAKIALRASWPGGPAEFELARLAGLLDIDMGKGRLLEIEPGGAGRILGLLNLRALQRRLSLDFSDIYKSGLTIDKMTGSFLIEDGQAYTNNMEIIGPAGRINISGRTGLADKDYDQLVSVTPRVGATLPIAGAILGGPVTGLAVLVAQTVISKAVPDSHKITKIHYSITGPWNNPHITKLKRNENPDTETTFDEQETEE